MNQFFSKLKSRIKRFLSEFYRVPYCVPAWGWAEHKAILKCLFTGTIIDGRHKEKLYELIRKKTGMKYVFGFNSGKEAIGAALLASGIEKGDKVIFPSYCCETVEQAVLACMAEPLFCDINDDYNPDIEHILKIIDDTVSAIIFPHLFGNPGLIDKLEDELSKKGIRSGILLIDDAAQSFGAMLNGKLIGTFGDAGIISFGPGKTMTASGGGLLITNSKKLSKNLGKLKIGHITHSYKIRRLLYWVIFRRWRKFSLPFFPFFKKLLLGITVKKDIITKLCNVDASIAIYQMNKLDTLLATRAKRKALLDNFMAEFDSRLFYLLPMNNSTHSTFNVSTKYLIRFNLSKDSFDVLQFYKNFFRKSGIEILPLYTPIHLKHTYSNFLNSLLKTETYYNHVIQVPVEPSISNFDFTYIINKLSLLICIIHTSLTKENIISHAHK